MRRVSRLTVVALLVAGGGASEARAALASPLPPNGGPALGGAVQWVEVQLYVYNVLGSDEGAGDVVLQAQILSGAKSIAASKPQPVTVE